MEMINVLTKADIEKNAPVIVKWDKPLVDNDGHVTDGVLAGQAAEFIPRIEQESKLLSELRYIEMEGETQDIQALRVRPKLQNGNKLTNGAQIDDLLSLTQVAPDILKSTLTAQFFTAYTVIPKTFIKTNIEKEGFIAKYESLLAPACAADADIVSIFGKVPANNQTASGYEAIDGILAQLDAVRTYYDANVATNPELPMGRFTDISTASSLIPQLYAMYIQFLTQNGKDANAKLYVSAMTYAKMVAESANRQTAGGDDLYFHGGKLYFYGFEVVKLDALAHPQNDYGEVAIMMDPDSVGYGPVMEAESEGEYKIERKGYLTSIDFMFDVGIIFPEDVIYAKITTPSGSD